MPLQRMLLSTVEFICPVLSLLFVLDSSVGAIILLLHQAIAAPILYDFYKYDADWKQFAQLFVQFTQKCSVALRSRETTEPGKFCRETGEIVAIKKVLQDKHYKNRELQIMQMLDHPNLCL